MINKEQILSASPHYKNHYGIKRTIKDFLAEGNLLRTFYRKAMLTLFGKKLELGVVEPYISGLTLNVGCGNTAIKNTVSVDNLLHRKFSDWELQPDVIADVLGLPYKNSTVDNVVALHVWEHVDSHKFLSEMYRVLKRGGRLAAVLPNYDYWGSKNYYRDPTHLWGEDSTPDKILDVVLNWIVLHGGNNVGKDCWKLIQLNKLGGYGNRWSYDIVLEKL